MSDMASAFDKALSKKTADTAAGLIAIQEYKRQISDGLQRKIDAEHSEATKKITPDMKRAYVEAHCFEVLTELKQGMIAIVHNDHGYVGLKPEQIPDEVAGLALRAKFKL